MNTSHVCESDQSAHPAHDAASRELPRHEARARALEMLYEREIKDIPCSEMLESLVMSADAFALMVVQGVCDNAESIDRMLDEASTGWAVDRMPVVDRLILRMATYELMALAEIPLAVVLDEAVELANEYSTEDSGRFVNGVLANISATVRATDVWTRLSDETSRPVESPKAQRWNKGKQRGTTSTDAPL